MAITLRTTKGSELTHAELDANFTTLEAADAALAATDVTLAAADVTLAAADAAHAALTVAHGATGAVVGTTNTQALTNKTIVVASNTVTTASSGNLAATELNAALAELQTDIDTRATSSALNAHIDDTTAAHAASAISYAGNTNLSATTVEAALDELDNEKQPLDATLTALAGLATGADKLAYSTGTDAFSQTTLTSFARTVLDDTDAATLRTTTGTEPTLLAETTVTGSAVTSVQFTGLDINTHKSYRIELEFIGAGSGIISMFANGDTTISNYYRQFISASGSTLSTGRSNDGYICAVASSAYSAITIFLSIAPDGALSAFVLRGDGAPSAVTIECSHWIKTSTATNLTQLDFTSTVASTIGVGSKIRIYRGDK